MHFDLSQTDVARHRIKRLVVLAVALIGFMSIITLTNQTPADAAGACTGPNCDSVALTTSDARYTLYSDAVDGSGVRKIYFGNPGDEPLMGDWNCDGEDTPAMYRRSAGLMYLRNSNTQGNADQQFYFGSPGDIPIAGDFNGNGCDTVSIYRPAEQRFYMTNKLGGGFAEYEFGFGNPGDTPFVGDFNGDGVDTVGLHRQSTGRVYITNNVKGGSASEFVFGDPGDIVFAGDWNGDGRETVAAYRGSTGTIYMRNSNKSGPADASLWVGKYKYAMPASGLPTFTDGVAPATFDVDVEVYPGDNIESLARNKPEGTVFRLHGTHKGKRIAPRTGQVFIAGNNAKLDGQGSEEHAFRSSARNVHIEGIEITNYDPDKQDGVIQTSGDGWVIKGNEIHHNDAVGVKVYKGDDVKLIDNNIHHNEQLGISVAYSEDTLVQGNTIAYNNWQKRYSWGFEAGGTKFWSTHDLVVRANHSHHNHGPGLWTDHDNTGTVYESNTVEDNYAAGIYHEISYNAVIRNNTLKRNGFGHDSWLWGGGITLSSSGGVSVYGNHVEGNFNGITMVQQSRGSGEFGSYTVKNNKVTNNVIINSGKSGAAQDIGSQKIFSNGNDFQGNRYQGSIKWEWDNRRVSFDTWQDRFGLDRSGSYKK